MNCANCHSRLFFFADNEELFPGSELVFCYACRKKITPFLEERNTYSTHAAHLNARRRELELSGVTPAGISALTAYCSYLDRIAPRRREVAAPQPSATNAASVPDAFAEVVKQRVDEYLPVARQDETLELNERIDTLAMRVRLALTLAGISGLTGIGSLIAVLYLIFLK